MKRWKMLAVLAVLALTSAPAAAETAVTVGVANLLTKLDPGIDNSNQGAQNWDLVYDALVRRDYNSVAPVYKPALAESWSFVAPDTVEFKLRRGVVFHNGDPMTSKDVVFSINRLIDGKNVQYLAIKKQFFESLKSAEAVDDYTVRVKTSPADPIVLTLLSTTQASIVPADYTQRIGFDAFNTAPVGTGPFKVATIEANSRIVFERFDKFWGDKPNVDRVVLRRIPETGPRITALVNGEVDIVTNIPPDQVPLIANAKGVKAVDYLTPGFHIITYNTNNAAIPRKVRQAMNMAIDRKLLNEALWNNKAVIPTGHQYQQFGELYDASRKGAQYDPEKAKQLLKEAGYNGEPIRFDAFAVYYTNGMLAAQAIAEMWKAIGLNITLNTIEVGTPVDKNTQVRAWSNPLYFPDPAGSFGTMWSPTGARVPLSWNVEMKGYADLYNAFRFELDVKKRKDLYGKLMDLMDEEVPFSLLYNPVEYYGVRDRVKWGPQPGAQPYTLNFRADNLSLQ